MIRPPAVEPPQLASLLGRASPLVKLAVAAAWLAGLVAVVEPRSALVLLAAALLGAWRLGAVPPARIARGVAPLWAAALVIGLFNTLFAAANGDPQAAVAAVLGPFRITVPAVAAGVALGLRILVIAAVSIAFAATTEATALADALVQQARAPARFAYGALAAYQAVPRLAEDLGTLREARRIRGLRGEWHPRLLVALLVLAVRHAERLALAMDARGFDAGTPRSRYRIVRWGRADALVLASGATALAAALFVARF